MSADDAVSRSERGENAAAPPADLRLALLHGVELGMRTYDVHRAVFDVLNAALAPTGLFFRAFAVLEAFVAGAGTAGEATRVLGLGDSGAWDAVKVLEQKGYIQRAGKPGVWGRTVTVTAEGRQVHHEAVQRALAAEQGLVRQLGEIDVIEVLRCLAEVARPSGARGGPQTR